MRITINGKEVIIPSSLSELTLGQRITFQQEHGNTLDEMLKSIIAMEDGYDKDLEITEFQFEKMVRTFAFFTGCTIEAVKESEYLDNIANIYHSSLAVLLEEEAEMELQKQFVWNNEVWEIHPPELKHGSKMKFGELIDAKQLIKDAIEFGESKWEYIPRICAIYLRKQGEEYQKEFLFEGSERIELMKSLPMNIAMQVGFFLSASINTYWNTLQSLQNPESNRPASLAGNILTDGVG